MSPDSIDSIENYLFQTGAVLDANSKVVKGAILRRSSVGRFSQSYWTKELSIGKRHNGNSGQFGYGVGPR